MLDRSKKLTFRIVGANDPEQRIWSRHSSLQAATREQKRWNGTGAVPSKIQEYDFEAHDWKDATR